MGKSKGKMIKSVRKEKKKNKTTTTIQLQLLLYKTKTKYMLVDISFVLRERGWISSHPFLELSFQVPLLKGALFIIFFLSYYVWSSSGGVSWGFEPWCGFAICLDSGQRLFVGRPVTVEHVQTPLNRFLVGEWGLILWDVPDCVGLPQDKFLSHVCCLPISLYLWRDAKWAEQCSLHRLIKVWEVYWYGLP